MSDETHDLAQTHRLLSDLFSSDADAAERLTDQQLADFEQNGFVTGPAVLNSSQVESLRQELAEFTNPDHSGRELWYEYHTNESADPDTVLFHALGAWRLRPGFHDILWNSAFTVPASQLLGAVCDFGTISCSASRRNMAVLLHGIRTIPIGRARHPWRI